MKYSLINIIKIFCGFILLISSNYLGELYPSKIRNILHNNVFIKYILAYITILIFFILKKENNKILNVNDLYNDIILSLIIFILFMASSKCSYWYFVIGMGCILIGFILKEILNIYFNNDNIKYNKIKKKWTNISNIILYLGCSILIIGFIIKLLRFYNIYKNNFSFILFFKTQID